MKIYTKTGDKMRTSINKRRVLKDDDAINLVGTIDELQTSLMVAYNFTDFEKIRIILLGICQDLFTYSYDLITEGNNFPATKVKEFEKIIDEFSLKLPKLTEFVVPGKTRSSSLIHSARTTTRRLERIIVGYAKNHKVAPTLLQYINRLSDLLYILARVIDEKIAL